jgi:hypothetical protein
MLKLPADPDDTVTPRAPPASIVTLVPMHAPAGTADGIGGADNATVAGDAASAPAAASESSPDTELQTALITKLTDMFKSADKTDDLKLHKHGTLQPSELSHRMNLDELTALLTAANVDTLYARFFFSLAQRLWASSFFFCWSGSIPCRWSMRGS